MDVPAVKVSKGSYCASTSSGNLVGIADAQALNFWEKNNMHLIGFSSALFEH